jgi:hypothetical protein
VALSWNSAAIEASGRSAPSKDDGRGGRKRTTANRDGRRGTPQGAPISPLLSNLYIRRFIVWWKQSGREQRLGAHIVNYADDLVICCRLGRAQTALAEMRQGMGRLKLMVNEEKTSVRRAPAEEFDFLGYTFGRRYAVRSHRPYIGAWPSKRSVQNLVADIHEQTLERGGCPSTSVLSLHALRGDRQRHPLYLCSKLQGHLFRSGNAVHPSRNETKRPSISASTLTTGSLRSESMARSRSAGHTTLNSIH